MRKKSGLITLVVLVVLSAVLYSYRNSIADWYRLRGYDPPVEISQLATDITLTPDSRRLFYVNHPKLTESEEFNEHCRENEYTIVLGCYMSGESGIYLLNVTDERLSGVIEVTAAHEFLHAAYERLSGRERERVDTLLTQAFVNLENTRVHETIELYRKQDPMVVPNELHSILGTEVRNLPDDLEEYYSQYFSDRSKIVGYSEQYEQAFVERRNAVRDYDQQLSVLKQQIDSLTELLTQTDTQLKAQRAKMNAQRSSGDTAGYNEQVPSYNAKVNQYNADIDRLSALIVQYNDIVQKRNSVAAEEAELVEAIDSREIVPEQQ